MHCHSVHINRSKSIRVSNLKEKKIKCKKTAEKNMIEQALFVFFYKIYKTIRLNAKKNSWPPYKSITVMAASASAINFQLFVINCQLFLINCQQFLIICQLFLINCQIFLTNRQIFLIICQRFLINWQLFLINWQLFLINRQLFLSNHQLFLINHQLLYFWLTATISD